MNSDNSPLTESARKIIFDAYGIDLPISGGWGVSIDSACVIDKNDSSIDNSMPFDGVEIEYVFVEKRIYLELIVFRPKDEFNSLQSTQRRLVELLNLLRSEFSSTLGM